MFENNLIAGSAGQATGFYPYAINQSLRFNDDDSAYLSRTPATAGNRKTWTWSGWVKRGNTDINQATLFSGVNTASQSTGTIIRMEGSTLEVLQFESSLFAFQVETAALHRDPSAWYHFVVSVDTTNATASDRIKLYVNGGQVTAFTTENYPSQNFDTHAGNNTEQLVGAEKFEGGPAQKFHDGYLAEINFIDGQALDPTSFGEFKSGVWVPKEYTGTYGTNGFYLPFENGLGNDESGNGNDWTPNNLAATDIVLDSPTNNFGVMNAVAKASSITLSEGNLDVREPGANDVGVYGTHPMTSGKYYFEYKYVGGAPYQRVGIEATSDYSTSNFNTGIFINPGGAYDDNSSVLSLNGSPAAQSFSGDAIVMMAVDADNGKAWFGINGSWTNSGDPAAGTNHIIDIPSGESVVAAVKVVANTSYIVSNFGQDSSFAGNETAQGNTDENGIGDFYYTPPAGFLALCTANLPEPAISPADDASPSDYFNTVLYTGNSSAQAITGVGFQPDLLWMKSRTATYQHGLFTVLQGVNDYLISNSTTAELNDSTLLNSFDTDGFTLNSGNAFNQSGQTYVAWNWKANGAGVTNTDGSITSTVSASPESGFSIVSYTGIGSNATVGHGLDSAPSFIVAKRRDSTGNWICYHSTLGVNQFIYLNKTDSASSFTGAWGSSITSTTFGITGSFGDSNASGGTYIAYCFAEVEGYSKFGSYTGNGSSDGPFVYTGFRPAFVMIKRTDSTQNWPIVDTSRDTYNIANKRLFSNLSSADDTGIPNYLDLLSNGFKCRDGNVSYNASGGTYIYMAFAENPFKFSNAR